MGMDLRLLWVWLGVATGVGGFVPAGAAYSQCQMEGGKCAYHIHLSEGCDSSYITNQIQSDYDEKVNEIERNLIDVRLDHQRRMDELENRISQMMFHPTPQMQPMYSSTDSQPADSSTFRVDGTPDRKENSLLTQLHDEFSALRRELARLKRKLRATESLLTETRNKLNKAEREKEQMRKELAATKDDLLEEKQRAKKLEAQLTIKDKELDNARSRLSETTRKLHRKERELEGARKENRRLKDALGRCEDTVEDKEKIIKVKTAQYEVLEEVHHNTTIRLNKTYNDLIECYRGKKNTFCGFEDPDHCGFIQDGLTDSFDWTWWSQKTPSSWTGPVKDHTCGNDRGHYMFVEASHRSKGQTAKLVSPKYQGIDEQCMEFYYHMYGTNTGTLNVYFMAEGQDLPPPVWRAFGNQGNVWTMARLQVPARVAFEGYKVVFEALMENGSAGDIGLDDIRIFTGSCHGTPSLEHIRIKQTNKVRDALIREGR